LLHFIPTPIGNLEDISLRSLRLLEEAEIILCEDTRVTKRLLSLLTQKHQLSPKVQTYISMHSHNEKEVLKKLTKEMFEQSIIYVSDAGMPSISDPGTLLVQHCQKNNIPFDILPGANAALLAYASSGFLSNKFLFFGFLPHKGNDRTNALEEALFSGYVTIVYESPHRLLKLIDQIVQIDQNIELYLIKEATKMYQKSFKGSSLEIQKELKEQNIKGEWVVVINSKRKEIGSISVEDILKLDIPKKQASKLIAKITGKSPKECYLELI
jgi:16S rRNA (cytidine1402-2'-O)-methyltransferase